MTLAQPHADGKRRCAWCPADPLYVDYHDNEWGIARAYLAIRDSHRSFDDYIWQFTNGKVLRRRPLHLGELAQTTPQSDAMSKALKQRGFRFVGSTICHAFMQAVGIVDEHQRYC